MNEDRKVRWGRKWLPPLPWQHSETPGRLGWARLLRCADVTSSTSAEATATATAAAVRKTKAEGTLQHLLQNHENLVFFVFGS